MAEPRSPPETADLLASFHTGYLKEIQHQLVATRSELRSGQDRIHTSIDQLLVLTGQVLEAVRMATPAPPQSGPQSLWQMVKDYLQSFVLLTRVLQALRSIPWGIFAWLGYGVLKWLGLV
jgi:hypothetical protein